MYMYNGLTFVCWSVTTKKLLYRGTMASTVYRGTCSHVQCKNSGFYAISCGKDFNSLCLINIVLTVTDIYTVLVIEKEKVQFEVSGLTKVQCVFA